MGVLVLGFLPMASHPATAVVPQPSALGLIVPLYAYPTDPSWSGLIHAKESYPNVPVIAVIAPSPNGPGGSYDSNFASGIARLQDAGITVLGYLNTQYAGQSLSTVKEWTSEYSNWYNVDGIFFDCMANWDGDQNYYSNAAAYAESLGLSFNVGNPGTSTLQSYVGIDNLLVIYENPGTPSVSTIRSAAMGDSSSNFALQAYATNLPSESYLSSVSQYVSWVYFTDAGGSDPYQTLPSYINTLMSRLSSIDGQASSGSATGTSGASSTSGQSGGAYALNVNSVNSFGNTIDGYWTVLYNSAGSSLATGYTPSVYTLNSGAGYQVEADGYAPCTFSHWEGGGLTGSTQDPAPITIDSPTTITAVYSGSACGPQVANSSTPSVTPATLSTTSTSTTTGSSTSISSSGSPSVTVESLDQNGQTITGYWTVLYSGSGSQIATGYTAKTFKVTAGASYSIELDGYNGCSFQYWQDTTNSGDLNFTAVSGQQAFVGVYNCN
jgi:hypothetical protein